MQFIKNNSYLLLIVVLCMVFTMIGLHKMEREVAYQQLVVAEGDTLWDYSRQYANNVPAEKWIEEIVKLNHLSSTAIQAGDELRIPVKRPHFNQNDVATNLSGKEE